MLGASGLCSAVQIGLGRRPLPPIFHPLTSHPFPTQSNCCLPVFHVFVFCPGRQIYLPISEDLILLWSFSLPLKKILFCCLLLPIFTSFESNNQKQGFIAHSLYPAVQVTHQSWRVCLGSFIALSTWKPCSIILVSWAARLPCDILQEASQISAASCPHSTWTPLQHGFLFCTCVMAICVSISLKAETIFIFVFFKHLTQCQEY